MGPKKNKGKVGKGKKTAEQDDHSTKELLTLYKKSCKELEFPIYKPLDLSIQTRLEEGGHLNQILINEQFGPQGIKTITKALKATKYDFKKNYSLLK